MRGAFRPEDEELASILSGVRAVYLAGLEMQRSAGLVLFALVDEVALNHIERFGHAVMVMCWNHRVGLHNDVLHYRPQSVVRVADRQRDFSITPEGETIRLDLTAKYFLINHDTVSLCWFRHRWAVCTSLVINYVEAALRLPCAGFRAIALMRSGT